MKRSSSTSCCEEDLADELNDRKETQSSGAVKWLTYKMFFKAVHSSVYITTVIILFVLAQIAATGCEYFLSAW